MKKIKLLSLLLALSLLLCGCGGKNSNIKLAPISLSAANFYHQSINEVMSITSMGESKLEEGEDNEAISIYQNMSLMTSICEINYYMAISALDFCIDIAENQSEETTKFFEYAPDQSSGQKIAIIVDKQKGKSVYKTQLYMVYGNDVNFNDIINNQEPSYLHNYSISRNKTDGKYDFSDSKNDINGNLLFNAAAGKMEMILNYVQQDETPTGEVGEITFNTKTFLYNYTNNALGSRRIITVTSNGVSSNIIQESLCKDYYKAMKIGSVKNEEEYVDMEKTNENLIGVSNKGDGYGFNVLYTHATDLSGEITTIVPYGIFPSLG